MCSREAIKTFVDITYHISKSDAHKGKVTSRKQFFLGKRALEVLMSLRQTTADNYCEGNRQHNCPT
jgi:hypothetical protein